MKAKLIKKTTGIYKIECDGKLIASTDDNMNKHLEISKLSLKNCQAIGRGYDLDELIAKKVNDFNIVDKAVEFSNANPKNNGAYLAYIAGAYEMAKQLELMSDKKFSEFLDKEKELGISDIKTIERIQWYYNTYFDKSQQTEWDVEIEMECRKVLVNGYKNQPANVIGFVADYEEQLLPKLDADGCLILKLKSE